MYYKKLRNELQDYYLNHVNGISQCFCNDCEAILDGMYTKGMSAYKMKAMQYRVIGENIKPKLFSSLPFYFETQSLTAGCDGAGHWRGGYTHACGWTYRKNKHLFEKQDKELWNCRVSQAEELFYLICGPYNDVHQHFCFNFKPILENGFKSVYDKIVTKLSLAKSEEEREFLSTASEGILTIKLIAEKFAKEAERLLENEECEENKRALKSIAESAKRCPWEAPTSFYEALATLAFTRRAVGTLEGIGICSFGRIDKDLYPFYDKDIKSGKLTTEDARELIAKFLLMFDMQYDHDMKMVAYSDHEFENTYTLGGVDEDGNQVYNELTRLFLEVARKEKIIYPKIKCRFSKESKKEYLEDISKATVAEMSTILYQNDDASIPALINAGKSINDARGYIISGCWDMSVIGKEKSTGGNYVNLMKPFEYSVHRLNSPKLNMEFMPLDDAKSFDEVYDITLENIRRLLVERARITRLGGGIWNKVSPVPLFSSTLDDCIEKGVDLSAGGARYMDENYQCFGFPNIVDSLLAIKELCFDEKRYTLKELLSAVRDNWKDNEKMRIYATRCHGFGDGSDESIVLSKKFQRDLYDITKDLKGAFGNKILLGFVTYTEIKWWGERTLATPDGRHSGDYFSQGLTPSRLKKIRSATDVVNSMAGLDASLNSGNSVINIILPAEKTSLDLCVGFLRAVADSAIQSLQLNVVSKATLLDAQKHPEKYPNLIVRVTGFSARFTSLSPEWQDEVLTRNYYDEC